MAKYRLTKSNLLYYRQCPKRLFLSVHHPGLATFDPNKQLIFDQGHLVGEVARKLYPGGEMVEFTGDPDPSVEETKRLLMQGDKPIYEATFLHDEVLIRSDLMFPSKGGVRAIEVKQATSVKDTYHDDCAIQAWVVEQSGHRVHSFTIAHIDNNFVYPGDGNYRGLFTEVPMDEHIQTLQAQVPAWVADAKKVLEAKREPDIKVGKQCKNPYECPFLEYCSLEEPEYSVKKLPNPGKLAAQLEEKGYTDLRDVPVDMLPKPVHARMRRTVISGKAELDPAAGEIVRKLAYPRYYFDFESINFAVPIWKGTWPYQQVSFQWSCHVQHHNGTLTHAEFLDTSGGFPARECAEQLLIVLGEAGPIVVYFAAFEKTRLKEFAELYPDLAARINAVIDRLYDIWPVMKEHYYHPSMNGSWSLKKVLPTIVPDLDYAALGDVSDGGGAQRAYIELINPQTDAARKEVLRHALLQYCGMDTMAMVRIVRVLSGEES